MWGTRLLDRWSCHCSHARGLGVSKKRGGGLPGAQLALFGECGKTLGMTHTASMISPSLVMFLGMVIYRLSVSKVVERCITWKGATTAELRVTYNILPKELRGLDGSYTALSAGNPLFPAGGKEGFYLYGCLGCLGCVVMCLAGQVHSTSTQSHNTSPSPCRAWQYGLTTRQLGHGPNVYLLWFLRRYNYMPTTITIVICYIIGGFW